MSGSRDSGEGPLSAGAVKGRRGGGDLADRAAARDPVAGGGRAVGTAGRLAASVPQADRSAPSGSMRVDAKLIRVINLAAPRRGPTQVSATNW